MNKCLTFLVRVKRECHIGTRISLFQSRDKTTSVTTYTSHVHPSQQADPPHPQLPHPPACNSVTLVKQCCVEN